MNSNPDPTTQAPGSLGAAGEWSKMQTGRHFRRVPEWRIFGPGVEIVCGEADADSIISAHNLSLSQLREELESALKLLDSYVKLSEKQGDGNRALRERIKELESREEE